MRTPHRPKPEQCRICGCTSWRACYDGCGWANATHTLCTRCMERIVDFATLTLLGARLRREQRRALFEEIVR